MTSVRLAHCAARLHAFLEPHDMNLYCLYFSVFHGPSVFPCKSTHLQCFDVYQCIVIS
jgi:hypothetical protein